MPRPKKIITEAENQNEEIGFNANGEQEKESTAQEIKPEKKEIPTEDYDTLIKTLTTLQGQVRKLEDDKQSPVVHQMVKAEERKFGSGLRRQISPDDRLEKPYTFITRGRGFIVSVYMKEGTEIYSPYERPIVFELKSSDVKRSGKAEDVIHFAMFSTWSKKEVEYIKESPYYNVTVFDSVAKAVNINPKLHSSIEAATNYVSLMSQDQVLAACQQYSLDARLGMEKVKERLTAIKLEEILSQEEYFNKKTAERIFAPRED